MKTQHQFRQPAGLHFRCGFSLVELLVVLTIVCIISAATVPAFQSVLESNALTQGGQTLVGEINLARQIASSRNMSVQVRLIQLAEIANSSATGYNAIQLWGTPSGSSAPVALNSLVILPAPVVISQDTTNYSKLLASGDAVAASSTMQVTAGAVSFMAFSIMPSGMIPVTNVSTGQASQMQATYLSVVPARFGAASATPGTSGAPANYLVVQMNPDTSSTVVYRP